MLRSPSNMNILKKLFHSSIAFCLLTSGLEIHSAAQSTPFPQPVQSPPSAPGQSPDTGQPSKMVPTGLSANGGSIVNSVYTNSIYGFSLKTPPGWAVVPGNDPNVRKSEPGDSALLKSALIRHTLLVMTENAPLRKAYQRKSIQILASRLTGQPGPTVAQDYLTYSQKTAKEKGMPVEYLGSPEEVTIHGQKLWRVASNETAQDGTVQHVEQYVITRGAALLQFFIVSPDEPGLKDLEPSIQSLEFKTLPPIPSPNPSSKTSPKKPKAAANAGSKPQ
jgi:hypothetical protein